MVVTELYPKEAARTKEMGLSSWPPTAHLEKDQQNSVLIDPKDADSVQLGQFGDQNTHQGDCVDNEVYPVIFSVEAGKEITVEEKKKMWMIQVSPSPRTEVEDIFLLHFYPTFLPLWNSGLHMWGSLAVSYPGTDQT